MNRARAYPPLIAHMAEAACPREGDSEGAERAS